jgi:hypothetical protein
VAKHIVLMAQFHFGHATSGATAQVRVVKVTQQGRDQREPGRIPPVGQQIGAEHGRPHDQGDGKIGQDGIGDMLRRERIDPDISQPQRERRDQPAEQEHAVDHAEPQATEHRTDPPAAASAA